MKKNFLLLLLFFLFTTIANAQFTTGQKTVGAQIGFFSNNYHFDSPPAVPPANDYKYVSTAINLSWSRFASPEKMVGFGVAYNSYYNHYRLGTDNTSEGFDRTQIAGLFANRIWLKPVAKRLYVSFTATAEALYRYDNANNSINVGSRKTNTYEGYIAGGIGLFYQCSQRFILTCDVVNMLTMDYQHAATTLYTGNNIAGHITSNSVTLQTGLNKFDLGSLLFGFRYILKN